MVFASGLEEQETAYALTADEIRAALDALGTADRAVSTGSCELR
jgi:hypothetical protein